MRRFAASFLLLLGFVALTPPAVSQSDTIRRAIERGVKYLKSDQATNAYLATTERLGRTALAGLALLESDVPFDDPVVMKITARIREKAFYQHQTYDMALALMYLDRLGDEDDLPIIQFLGIRLLFGETSPGTWSYSWGTGLTEADVKQLRTALGRVELKGRKGGGDDPDEPEENPKKKPKKIVPKTIDPENDKKQPVAKKSDKADRPRLHPELKKWMQRLQNNQKQGGNGLLAPEIVGGGDHSNTQFAVLALWIGRRHGVPSDAALTRTEQHFRNAQQQDGGWSYQAVGNGGPIQIFGGSSAPMTCAGILALALGHGIKITANGNDPKKKAQDFDPYKDPWMRGGLNRLEGYVADARNNRRPQNKGLGEVTDPTTLSKNYYFLWSLERVGVVFGLEKIGNEDWFGWGSEVLLASQGQDGSWSGGTYSGATADVDTSFALLFLNRANLAKDLTNQLKRKTEGTSTLKNRNVPRDDEPEKTPKDSPKEIAKNDPRIPDAKLPTIPINADPTEKQIVEMVIAVIQANPNERKKLLEKYRDSKGSIYTVALARSIPRLEGDDLKEARDALALRLTRMTANTLREMLKDSNREIRRAAALACAMKEDREHVPDLISTLSDRDPVVNRAAHAALKALTNQDFGPDAEATEADRAKAITAWSNWWSRQKR